MVAKTGRIRSHWAHAVSRDWDSWWEVETDWHRAWKAHFPEAWREVGKADPTGEIHRADVWTPSGLVLEFQHSCLRDEELSAREAFYSNLVWVLDGRPFRQNFQVHHPLPHPDADIAQDVVWESAKPGWPGTYGGLYFLRSEYERDNGPVASKAEVRSGYIHAFNRIEAEVIAAHAGHYQYGWVRPRRGWLTASAPVFIDFCDGYLWQLEIYPDGSGLACCRVTSSKRFLMIAMTARTVEELTDGLWGPPQVLSGRAL